MPAVCTVVPAVYQKARPLFHGVARSQESTTWRGQPWPNGLMATITLYPSGGLVGQGGGIVSVPITRPFLVAVVASRSPADSASPYNRCRHVPRNVCRETFCVTFRLAGWH